MRTFATLKHQANFLFIYFLCFQILKNHLPRDEVLKKEVTHSKSPASRSIVGSLSAVCVTGLRARERMVA